MEEEFEVKKSHDLPKVTELGKHKAGTARAVRQAHISLTTIPCA